MNNFNINYLRIVSLSEIRMDCTWNSKPKLGLIQAKYMARKASCQYATIW